ncbi:MAG TPA: imidazole glycerol phosphate synthase subunit HisH [Dehalococcoidia bacterium]|jgi:glutamine amidotransferase|nr:imidazole glycerol phosphate synthase subunit HisH [Chloroflexota bacterium]MDP6055717.1 imidazole glycerol phosphate synthase subunit HisH [Dehalococcoidia bacterium]MDP7090180.1 imidazole glycerol phosphate synthase subunit HisH [Dehalococcoidia bacterium]MDP7262075.1 imidazole glycerol phosphate synthase subunit HisH [Dehalococcoidia bacterium]MDP7484701.1 imidazole glycerol phosphate synthase subunit HisH [Dehalococcoidia bacterium]|tara:strand:+ start:1812 stop:2486 length:675 start_codon:yes stop_codon:yes gene_type:complete
MTNNSGKPHIVVLNTRAANVHSVEKALRKVGADPVVTSDPAELATADAAVLPGVGSSDAVMNALNTLEMSEPVKEFAASGKPLLCVCVGLQVLFDSSEEGELPGLGLVEGNVQLIPTGMTDELGSAMKVPHMGWNAVRFTNDDANRNLLFKGIPQGSHFYFVHSYRCVPNEQVEVAATTDYGVEICAAIARGNVAGTQFHPEKSGDVGLQIYKNFLDLASTTAK